MNMGVPKNAEFYADSKLVEMGLKKCSVKSKRI